MSDNNSKRSLSNNLLLGFINLVLVFLFKDFVAVKLLFLFMTVVFFFKAALDLLFLLLQNKSKPEVSSSVYQRWLNELIKEGEDINVFSICGWQGKLLLNNHPEHIVTDIIFDEEQFRVKLTNFFNEAMDLAGADFDEASLSLIGIEVVDKSTLSLYFDGEVGSQFLLHFDHDRFSLFDSNEICIYQSTD